MTVAITVIPPQYLHMRETGDDFKDMEAGTTAASKYPHGAKKLACTSLTHFKSVTNAINWWKPSHARLGNPGAADFSFRPPQWDEGEIELVSARPSVLQRDVSRRRC